MRISRLYHTLKYLKPIQFFYRFKNRTSTNKKHNYTNIKHRIVDLFIDGLHNNKLYLERFKTENNRINILNQVIDLNYVDINNLSPLLRFNLEYFEYAIVWAQTGIPFSFLKDKWNEYVARNIKLQPYVISLQIPNMIIAMGIYGVDDQSIYDELYSRYKWLIKHQEKHLLANHYFENLKAIVIASYVFNEERVFERYLKRIKRECREEVLEDGVHFELSFMYHKLILEDLLLLRRIINADWLNQLINKMISAGVSIENGLDRTPLFNDSGNNVAKPIEALKLACKKELGITPILTQSLNHSGYHKIYDGDLSIVIDSGIIGPKYNPGHGHCDCLSFELFKNNKPLLVNSGTYQYQGDKRLFFRSSRAHNVAVVDNQEQSDCWGEHRVGKRIKKTIGRIDGQLFVGSFVNQYGYKYVRDISLSDGVLSVYDSFPNAKKDESVVSFLHLAPGYVYQGNSIKGFGKKYSIKTKDCTVEQIDSIYSSEFGKIEQNKCLLFRWKVDAKKHGYSINLNG